MFADLSELITTFIYEWSRNLCVCVRYLFFETGRGKKKSKAKKGKAKHLGAEAGDIQG